MENNRLVLPGDELATSEEYMPGEGTYDIEGKIYAAGVGRLILDEEEMVVTVRIMNEPVVPVKDDIIIGMIKETRQNMATVEVVYIEGKNRITQIDAGATIHVSKISQNYNDNARKEFKIGEPVRAKVIQAEPTIQLATDEPELGILKAYCVKCRLPLTKRGDVLHCDMCDRIEHRKISDHYGRNYLLVQSTEKNMNSGLHIGV